MLRIARQVKAIQRSPDVPVVQAGTRADGSFPRDAPHAHQFRGAEGQQGRPRPHQPAADKRAGHRGLHGAPGRPANPPVTTEAAPSASTRSGLASRRNPCTGTSNQFRSNPPMSHPFLITGPPDLAGPLEVALFESGGKTLASVAWPNGIKVILKTAAQAREIAEAFNEAAINLDFNERRIADAAAELAPTAPERTATPAEHADTAARIERTRVLGTVADICPADWGSATESQRCTWLAGHGAVHRDASGHEWTGTSQVQA